MNTRLIFSIGSSLLLMTASASAFAEIFTTGAEDVGVCVETPREGFILTNNRGGLEESKILRLTVIKDGSNYRLSAALSRSSNPILLTGNFGNQKIGGANETPEWSGDFDTSVDTFSMKNNSTEVSHQFKAPKDGTTLKLSQKSPFVPDFGDRMVAPLSMGSTEQFEAEFDKLGNSMMPLKMSCNLNKDVLAKVTSNPINNIVKKHLHPMFDAKVEETPDSKMVVIDVPFGALGGDKATKKKL